MSIWILLFVFYLSRPTEKKSIKICLHRQKQAEKCVFVYIKCRWFIYLNSKKKCVKILQNCLDLNFESMKNTYKRNFLISLALVIVGSGMLIYSWARAFSYEADTAFTEFYFTWDFGSWDANLPIYNADGTIVWDWWPTWTINFVLVNNSDMTITGNFYVVDAISLIEWTNIYGCKWMSDSTYFGSHNVVPLTNRTMDTWLNNFSLTYDFWNSVSGVHTWCVIFQPVWNAATSQNSVADAIPRKALIFAVNLTGTNPSHQVTMIANVWSRRNTVLNDPHFKPYTSSGYLLVYSCSDRGLSPRIPLYTWFVSMDALWYGISDIVMPNWCYDVVYKWWQHLAAYMEWVNINNNEPLIFTTWSQLLSAWWLTYMDSEWLITYNSWNLFLIAWDMPNSEWLYNGNISVWDYATWIERCKNKWYISICDLNNDWLSDDTDYWIPLLVWSMSYSDVTNEWGEDIIVKFENMWNYYN